MSFVLTPNNIKIKVNKFDFTINNFPLHEYKILHLSDLHLGFGLGSDFLKELVSDIIRINPNIVVITGDLINGAEGSIKKIQEEIKGLKPLTAKIPTYFVLGNHESKCYIVDTKDVILSIKDIGINVLINESVVVDNAFNLVGIGDSFAKDKIYLPDFKKSFSNIHQDKPTIVLLHQPKYAKLLSKEYKFWLCLSGHIHGGQIYPIGLLNTFFQGHFCNRGFYRLFNGAKVYVSKGIGFSQIPIRIFAHSEMMLLTINNG